MANYQLITEIESAPKKAKDGIIRLIKKGEFSCGQRIEQKKLAQKLKVTIPPLREALSTLEAEGYLERVPGIGVFCKAYNVDDLTELLYLRTGLEITTSLLLIKKLTSSKLKKFKEHALRLENQEMYKNMYDFAEDHARFHLLIAKESGSKKLYDMLKNSHIIEQIVFRENFANMKPHSHHQITVALEEKSPEKIVKAMWDHVIKAYDPILKKLKKDFGNKPITF